MEASNPLMEVQQIFPIYLLKRKWEGVEELNKSLKELVLRRKDQSKGLVISNQGGWHSEGDLVSWDGEAIASFKDMIIQCTMEMLESVYGLKNEKYREGWDIESWANVNYKGNSNASHDHLRNNNQWSGVYYVQVGDSAKSDSGGYTVFEDRFAWGREFLNTLPTYQNGTRRDQPREISVKPDNGTMVMFPSSLAHRVNPYEGDNERITIAFNIKHPDFGFGRYYPYEEGASSTKKLKSWLRFNFRGPVTWINELVNPER